NGDILEGAKQNRVLNTSIFLAPASTTIVPVSCVEMGRWRYDKPNFTSSNHLVSPNLRSNIKSDMMNDLKKHKSDQTKVWNLIASSERISNKFSKTSNFSEQYADMNEGVNKFINSFEISPNVNGAALFFKSKLLSIDVYNRRDIYKEYFKKLITSSAIEIFHMKSDFVIDEQFILNKTEEILLENDKAPKHISDPVGDGIDMRTKTN